VLIDIGKIQDHGVYLMGGDNPFWAFIAAGQF
jgi:hypothetical protein